MKKHLEGHGEDCDHVRIFVISFLHCVSFLWEWPSAAFTVVDLVHESSRCLHLCMAAVVIHKHVVLHLP